MMLDQLARELRRIELEVGGIAAWLKEYGKGDQQLNEIWNRVGGAWGELGRACRELEKYVKEREK